MATVIKTGFSKNHSYDEALKDAISKISTAYDKIVPYKVVAVNGSVGEGFGGNPNRGLTISIEVGG